MKGCGSAFSCPSVTTTIRTRSPRVDTLSTRKYGPRGQRWCTSAAAHGSSTLATGGLALRDSDERALERAISSSTRALGAARNRARERWQDAARDNVRFRIATRNRALGEATLCCLSPIRFLWSSLIAIEANAFGIVEAVLSAFVNPTYVGQTPSEGPHRRRLPLPFAVILCKCVAVIVFSVSVRGVWHLEVSGSPVVVVWGGRNWL